MRKRIIAAIFVIPAVIILLLLPEKDPAVKALEKKCYDKHMMDDRLTFKGRQITYDMCIENGSADGDN